MNSLDGATVQQLYRALPQNQRTGIEGYHVDSKYLDPRRLKEEKYFFQLSMRAPKSVPLKPTKHKSSYLDEVQKAAKVLPSPGQYETALDLLSSRSRSKTSSAVKYADRKTIFDDLQRILKKDNFPSSASYATNPEKDRHHSNLSKAQSPDYLEAVMRNNIETPGVGQYNGKDQRLKWHGRFVKWKADSLKRDKSKGERQKLPPVGTYAPVPVAYDLFESIEAKSKKPRPNGFGKVQRFKSPDPKKQPKGDYNLVNEWGMKDKMKKKALLDKISRPSQPSVYY